MDDNDRKRTAQMLRTGVRLLKLIPLSFTSRVEGLRTDEVRDHACHWMLKAADLLDAEASNQPLFAAHKQLPTVETIATAMSASNPSLNAPYITMATAVHELMKGKKP